MTRTKLSVFVAMHPVGGVGSELAPSVGIDVQTSRGAPGDELLRINANAVNDLPGALSFVDQLLSATLPLVERRREVLSVIHDFENTGIVSALIPRDGNVLSARVKHRHFPPSVLLSLDDTVGEATGCASAPSPSAATPEVRHGDPELQTRGAA